MDSSEPLPPGKSEFPSTAWTLIEKLQDQSRQDHREILDRFITAYWKPAFCYLRARRFALEQAKDLTQEFFAELVAGRPWVKRADQEKGKFRYYLCLNLKSFVSDQTNPKRMRRQKAFETGLVSVEKLLGEEERSYEPPARETPESIFMEQWARALVRTVLGNLKQFYDGEGRLWWFEVFSTIWEGDERPAQEELAHRFNKSREQVRYALDVVEARFKHILREEVRDQVGCDGDVGDEIRELLALVGNR